MSLMSRRPSLLYPYGVPPFGKCAYMDGKKRWTAGSSMDGYGVHAFV
jgi:hypothetical protein